MLSPFFSVNFQTNNNQWCPCPVYQFPQNYQTQNECLHKLGLIYHYRTFLTKSKKGSCMIAYTSSFGVTFPRTSPLFALASLKINFLAAVCSFRRFIYIILIFIWCIVLLHRSGTADYWIICVVCCVPMLNYVVVLPRNVLCRIYIPIQQHAHQRKKKYRFLRWYIRIVPWAYFSFLYFPFFFIVDYTNKKIQNERLPTFWGSPCNHLLCKRNCL